MKRNPACGVESVCPVMSIWKATQGKVILNINHKATKCLRMAEQDGGMAQEPFPIPLWDGEHVSENGWFPGLLLLAAELSQKVLVSLFALPTTAVKSFISLDGVAEFICKYLFLFWELQQFSFSWLTLCHSALCYLFLSSLDSFLCWREAGSFPALLIQAVDCVNPHFPPEHLYLDFPWKQAWNDPFFCP